MNLTDYQHAIERFARYPEIYALTYVNLGLIGEAGEVADEIKKHIRNDGGLMTAKRSARIQEEIGDVLWYLARRCHHEGFKLGDFEPIGTTFETLSEGAFTLHRRVLGLVQATPLMVEDWIEQVLDALWALADLVGADIHQLASDNVAKLTERYG